MAWRVSAAVALLVAAAGVASGQIGTAFTYQGELTDASVPAQAVYDFQFRLFAVGDAQIAGKSAAHRADLQFGDGFVILLINFFQAGNAGCDARQHFRVHQHVPNGLARGFDGVIAFECHTVEG